MSTWRFDLAELDGTPIGTVQNATDRNLSLTLNGNSTASFTIRLDNERAEEITTLEGDVLLKVYQDDDLAFLGELVSAEEVGESGKQTLACNFAGPLWRLGKRWVGASLAGYSAIDTPANTVISYLITQANARKDTGVRLGTIDTLYNTSVGTDSPWTYKPVAEALTNLQESKVPYPIITPLDYLSSDNLSGTGAVDSRADNEGNHWDSNGTGADYTVTTGYAYRTDTGVAGTGRWAISDLSTATPPGPLLGGLEFSCSERTRLLNSIYFVYYVRLSAETAATPGSGNWLRVLISWDTTSGSYTLQKHTGGSPGTTTTLGTYSVDAGAGYFWAANTWYSIRVLIDELGNYWVYNYLSPGTIGIGYPGISGHDADLATGGALDDGKYAFGDAFNGVPITSVTRAIRNVFVSDYTGPQSFDFEFVPSEPTADTGQSGVVGAGTKLWTLNVNEPQIGSTTTTVFEFGPSMKSYNRKIDREGIITEAACFPSDGSTTDVRVSSDATAEAARGLYQDVVPNNDVSDGQLRQALADLNVNVRKQARQLITFEPTSRAPVFGPSGDYNIGDYVIGRAIVNDTERFNGTFRVFGVDISIDDTGKETVVPTLVPQ